MALQNFATLNEIFIHRNIKYIECSLELVLILAAKTVALQSGTKTGARYASTLFFLRALWFNLFNDFKKIHSNQPCINFGFYLYLLHLFNFLYTL
jgi:hypothetical protein